VITSAEKRAFLRSRGWRRCDRTSGGVSEELWKPPIGVVTRIGFEPCGVGLARAYKKESRIK
jgi:hypothetical protein